jgi:hypothetical protein
MNFKTADEFYDFCVAHDACEPGLAEIKGKTLASWWEETQHGDWMIWLRKKGVWQFNPEQQLEYLAKRSTLASEYWAKISPLEKDYWSSYADYLAKLAVLIREIVGNPFAGGAQ